MIKKLLIASVVLGIFYFFPKVGMLILIIAYSMLFSQGSF